mmetsp:Transcript_3499/g.6962  ORF Transcript_3499/g.6962 Transcript_3499/m.6962 type:complete len:437 (-) Transcript_3499:51-1361(-)
MSDQKELKKRLKVLMGLPENQVCSDCTERQPRWASLIVPPPGAPEGSLPIGAFCCLECSGSHRRLGVHISFVRSINLDSWKEREVLSMENGGNAKVNAIFEANLNRDKPTNHADLQTRERYIRDKYERRKFYDPSAFGSYRAAAPVAPPRSAAQQQPQEISLPALRPGPVGPPSDVAQRRIQERRRRNQSSGGSSTPSPDKNLRRVNSSEGKKKPSRKVKPQSSNTSSISQSSSIDLLDFSDPPPAPAPAPAKSSDLFGDFSTPSETFGNSFFGGDKPGHTNEKKSSAAADIMALYGAGGGGGGNQQSHGSNGFFNSGGMPQGRNGMNAMTNQMGQMDLSGRGVQQPMMTPQQQQQMMMMQQQQQMMMMMQQQGQGMPQNNMGGFNPQVMNGNMMMGQAPPGNGFGGQMAAMGTGGGRPQQKEDPFASLGGRNTFR